MKYLLPPALLSSVLLLTACGEGDQTLPPGDLTITDENAEKTAAASASISAVAAWHAIIAANEYSYSGDRRPAPANVSDTGSKLTIAEFTSEACETSGTVSEEYAGDTYTIIYEDCVNGSVTFDGKITSSSVDDTYVISFEDYSFVSSYEHHNFDGTIEALWDYPGYKVVFDNFTSQFHSDSWDLPEVFSSKITTYSGSLEFQYEDNAESPDYYTFNIDNLSAAAAQTDGQAITISTPTTLKFDAGSGLVKRKSSTAALYREPSSYPETGLIHVEGKRGTFLELDADTGVETTAYLTVNDSPTYQVTYDDLGIDFEYLYYFMYE